MGKNLNQIAKELRDLQNKVSLIYAFNGTGKTRLSLEFKELVSPENEENETIKAKMFYYNAFTEDLFYWDNDFENSSKPKLIIKPNYFTDWILKEQGQDRNIITNFQRYSNDKLTPIFNPDFSNISFSFRDEDNNNLENIKISKGEESSFIWSIFYTLMKQIINVLNEKTDRETDQFDNLEYMFIDDPVSSLDENHLIELAFDLAELIKSSKNKLKFIISTHNPLFYNVLYNELEQKLGYMLIKNDDESFVLEKKQGDSNRSFSYHLYLKQIIEKAIENESIEKFHFMLLRNLYEKTASFLGYTKWSELLPTEARESYVRYINLYSHRSLSNEEVSEPTKEEKNIISYLLNHLEENYKFYKEDKNNDKSN